MSESITRQEPAKLYLLYAIPNLGRDPKVKRHGYVQKHKLPKLRYTFFMLDDFLDSL